MLQVSMCVGECSWCRSCCACCAAVVDQATQPLLGRIRGSCRPSLFTAHQPFTTPAGSGMGAAAVFETEPNGKSPQA